MWLILMTQGQQWMVGLIAPVVVSSLVGLGGFQYWGGGLDARVTAIEHLDPQKMQSDIALNARSIERQDKRQESIEKIIIEGQKEQNQLMRQVLVSTAQNSTSIGTIQVDITEIKESLK